MDPVCLLAQQKAPRLQRPPRLEIRQVPTKIHNLGTLPPFDKLTFNIRSFPFPLKPPKVRKTAVRLWGPCGAHQADTDSAVLSGRGKHLPFGSDAATVKTAFERQTGVEASDLFKVEEA